MRTFRSSLIPFVLCTAAGELAAQPIAVSPTDRTALEGNSFSHYPLGRASARMQTLHDDVPGGMLITGHAYRRDAIGVFGTAPAFASDLSVTLSMSPNTASQASTTFASNVGANPVGVLPRTIVAFPPTDRPSLDPAPTFELQIPYAVPFLVPQQGGTLCVDVEIFGNQAPGGSNQNFSVYLDAHEHYTDGRAEQPAFRTGNGCPAPGQGTDCYANLTLWRLASGQTDFDLSIRNGVPDSGNGTTRAFLMLGNSMDGTPWPTRPDCPFWSSTELWFALPGTMDQNGDYDGSLAGLPLLPPGYRLWCQAGSIDLSTIGLAFSDALTFTTPPYGALPIPTMRIANGSNQAATTGSVSRAVPVIAFF